MGLEIINKLKKEKGLTNEALSLQSGVPLGTLSKITSGITKDPKLETLKALAKVLDCTLDDFDDTYNPQNHIDIKEAQLLENYKKLNAIAKDKLLEYSNDLVQIPNYKKENSSEIEITKNEISATKENTTIVALPTENKIDDEFTKILEARKKAEQYFKENPRLMPIASHDKEGEFTEEDYKHDMDIMMNDDFWK